MSKKGASQKEIQGGALPPDGSRLWSYPLGCCVLVEVGGAACWYLVSLRIGGSGALSCCPMSSPPNSRDWNVRLGSLVSVSEDTPVLSSAWPNRNSTPQPGEPGEGDRPVRGPVYENHVRSG